MTTESEVKQEWVKYICGLEGLMRNVIAHKDRVPKSLYTMAKRLNNPKKLHAALKAGGGAK